MRAFKLGVVKVSPLALGVIPFGMICGASSVGAGISVLGAVSMSLIMFAGASQLVVVQLLANDVSMWVILFTGVMINMRMLMYSASLSVHLGGESQWRKMGVAYLMTDQAFATSIRAYDDQDLHQSDKLLFYFGAGLFMWFVFVLSTWLGAVAGQIIPSEWSLDFVVPLTFLALLASSVKNQPFIVAAVVGGVVALSLYALPYHLGFMFGGLGGIVVGRIFEIKGGYEL